MIEVFLIYPTPEGSQEILMDGERLSLGRGGDADLRLDDDGMSRLNSTIYHEGEHVWILDENSTNGTFVNGREVPPSGIVLKNGDSIKLGHYTNIRIRISEKQRDLPRSESKPSNGVVAAASAPSAAASSFHILPIALMAFAVLVIGISAIFIGVKVFGNNQPEIVTRPGNTEDFPEDDNDRDTKKTPTPRTTDEKTPKVENSKTPETSINLTGLPESNDKTVNTSLPRKKFADMSEPEKDLYVKEKAEKVARIIGNQSSDPIPPEAVKVIRNHLQGYVNRVRVGRKEGGMCGFGSDMTTVLQRASKNAPFIIRAFYGEGLDPQVGLYVAMIESEHCPCLQSPTKALGMFQFVRGTGREYNLSVKDDASPTNPDQRCEPEPSAKAAAQYLKTLTGRFGTGPMSIPLAIASYNSGQGGLSKNLESALRTASSQERSFWTLVANQVAFEGKIGEQFRKENVKYVPKFFAAAIISENPQDFGINMQPLSTYTK